MYNEGSSVNDGELNQTVNLVLRGLEGSNPSYSTIRTTLVNALKYKNTYKTEESWLDITTLEIIRQLEK